MSSNTSHHPTEKPALLLMDFQNFILKNFVPPSVASTVLQQARKALMAARKAGIPIIHVNVAFRAGYPEIHSQNKMFSLVRDHNLAPAHSDAIQIDPALAPDDNEPVIYKHRVNAFRGTDLAMILQAQGINSLWLAGVTTSNVVLSTFIHASDLDYTLTVVRDACADGEADTHQFLMERFFPKLGDVLSTQDIITRLHG